MTHTTSVQSAADSRLFNVTDYHARSVDGVLEHVPLADIELADNPRKDINLEGIHRLAGMLMRSGQFVPTIGRRITEKQVLIYAGQRRLLAARASAELA